MKKLLLILLMFCSTTAFARYHYYDKPYNRGGVYFYYGPTGYYAPYGYRYYNNPGVVKRCWRHRGHVHCRYVERNYWWW